MLEYYMLLLFHIDCSIWNDGYLLHHLSQWYKVSRFINNTDSFASMHVGNNMQYSWSYDVQQSRVLRFLIGIYLPLSVLHIHEIVQPQLMRF